MNPIGTSPEWKSVMERVHRVAPLPTAVLVTGETGTGKELVARAIHAASGRAGKFVAVNCAMLTRELAEARLFGYAKGAYTGADRSRYGLIQSANKGTLFLDEVGELPLEVQAMLLRVLQDKVVSRMGGDEEEVIDFRLITATHQPVELLEGFRRDFFERVAEYRLKLPPLRVRGKDVVELARHILSTDPTLQQLKPNLLRSGEVALLAHSWPGNVRELATCLRTLAIDGLPLDGPSLRRYFGATHEAQEVPELERHAEPSQMPAMECSAKTDLRARALELLLQPHNAAWIATELGVSHRTALRYLKQLADAEQIQVVGRGRETLYARRLESSHPAPGVDLVGGEAACPPALESSHPAPGVGLVGGEAACPPALESRHPAPGVGLVGGEAARLVRERMAPERESLFSRLRRVGVVDQVTMVRQAIGGYG